MVNLIQDLILDISFVRHCVFYNLIKGKVSFKAYQFIIYNLCLKETVWCMSSNGNSRQNVYNPRRALIKLKEWEFENEKKDTLKLSFTLFLFLIQIYNILLYQYFIGRKEKSYDITYIHTHYSISIFRFFTSLTTMEMKFCHWARWWKFLRKQLEIYCAGKAWVLMNL